MVVFNFCTVNQSTESVQTSFNPWTPHGVLAWTIVSPVCMESELCYIGASAKLAPASPCRLTWTLQKLAQTLHQSAWTGVEYVGVGESEDLKGWVTLPSTLIPPFILCVIGFFLVSKCTPEGVIELLLMQTTCNMFDSLTKSAAHRNKHSPSSMIIYDNFNVDFKVAQPTTGKASSHTSMTSTTFALVLPQS